MQDFCSLSEEWEMSSVSNCITVMQWCYESLMSGSVLLMSEWECQWCGERCGYYLYEGHDTTDTECAHPPPRLVSEHLRPPARNTA